MSPGFIPEARSSPFTCHSSPFPTRPTPCRGSSPWTSQGSPQSPHCSRVPRTQAVTQAHRWPQLSVHLLRPGSRKPEGPRSSHPRCPLCSPLGCAGGQASRALLVPRQCSRTVLQMPKEKNGGWRGGWPVGPALGTPGPQQPPVANNKQPSAADSANRPRYPFSDRTTDSFLTQGPRKPFSIRNGRGNEMSLLALDPVTVQVLLRSLCGRPEWLMAHHQQPRVSCLSKHPGRQPPGQTPHTASGKREEEVDTRPSDAPRHQPPRMLWPAPHFSPIIPRKI